MLRIAFRFTKEVLLTSDQVERILEIVSGSDIIDSNYVKGDDGKYTTVYTLGTFSLSTATHNRLITKDEYNSLKFVTDATKSST